MIKNLFTLTLLKAFDILDCFRDDKQEIGIKEIAEMIDMPQSSVYRIIQSLEFIGLLFQNKENKKYRLGFKIMHLSQKTDSLNTCLDIAVKYMVRLKAECDETINLAIANCDSIINVHKEESSKLLRPNFISGVKYPAYCTGLGKVLMSEMSPSVLHWIYDNNSDKIAKSFDEFKDEIKQVRKQGYAFDDEEFNIGLRCVAAPIYGSGGRMIFSMSISAPTVRMDDERYNQLRDLVVEYSNKISEEIRRTVI